MTAAMSGAAPCSDVYPSAGGSVIKRTGAAVGNELGLIEGKLDQASRNARWHGAGRALYSGAFIDPGRLNWPVKRTANPRLVGTTSGA